MIDKTVAIDVERAGYNTLTEDARRRIAVHQEKAARLNRMKDEIAALYALVYDLTGASRESLSPEMKLLVKRACAIVRRVEDPA